MIGIVVIAYINWNNVFFVKVNAINLIQFLFSEEDKSYTNNLWWPSTTG